MVCPRLESAFEEDLKDIHALIPSAHANSVSQHTLVHTLNYSHNKKRTIFHTVSHPHKHTNTLDISWDWVQATPDRNTGLWDSVSLETTSDVVITDPIVQTLSVALSRRGDGGGHVDRNGARRGDGSGHDDRNGDGVGPSAAYEQNRNGDGLSASASAVIVPAAMLTNRGSTAITGILSFNLLSEAATSTGTRSAFAQKATARAEVVRLTSI